MEINSPSFEDFSPTPPSGMLFGFVSSEITGSQSAESSFGEEMHPSGLERTGPCSGHPDHLVIEINPTREKCVMNQI
jgi:hypothetical protein